jgi:hypothetical protein
MSETIPQSPYPFRLEIEACKPHAKEPDSLWIYRLLGLDPFCARKVQIKSIDEKAPSVVEVKVGRKTSTKLLTPHAAMAMDSHIRFHTKKDDPKSGVGIVIASPGCGMFFLQRKDLLHPSSSCHGRYALISGSAAVGENYHDALAREVFEEVRDAGIADYLLSTSQELMSVEAMGTQWFGVYNLFVRITVLSWAKWHEVVRSLAGSPGLSEASPAIVTRDEFMQVLLPQEQKKPGRHFVASHHWALQRALEEHSA